MGKTQVCYLLRLISLAIVFMIYTKHVMEYAAKSCALYAVTNVSISRTHNIVSCSFISPQVAIVAPANVDGPICTQTINKE